MVEYFSRVYYVVRFYLVVSRYMHPGSSQSREHSEFS